MRREGADSGKHSLDTLIERALKNGDSWPSDERFRQYLRSRGRRAAKAKALLPRFLAATKVRAWFDIANRHSEYRELEFVRVLVEHGEVLRNQGALRDSHEVLDQAAYLMKVVDVDAIPSADYCSLNGDLHREMAITSMYRGAYLAALAYLDDAEVSFGELAAPEYHFAVVKLVRALVYQRMKEHEEDALLLARESATVLEAHGDRRRAGQARMVEAILLYFRKDFVAAERLFVRAIEDARAANDVHAIACVYTNLGHCLREMGDVAGAAGSFAQALPLLESLGLKGDVARVKWGLARIETGRGRTAEALRLLIDAHNEFTRAGMVGDQASVALEVVELLLAAGDRQGAAQYAADLPRRFMEMGMTSYAIAAANYVKETVGSGTASPAKVQRVREYLRELQMTHDLPFDPPS